ncbi:MAG: flagellar basal body rod protein FlgB [Bacillota bacterium]
MSFDIDQTARLAEHSLRGLWTRQNIISENMANINTPGYKARRLSFERYLASALEGEDTHPLDFVSSSRASSMRVDGNNVDLEAEMVALTENSLKYRSVMNQLQRKMDTLNAIARE